MWHISKINNATHEVEITHKSGVKHSFVVPNEHRQRDLKHAFIKSQVDAQDAVLKVAERKRKSQVSLVIPWLLVMSEAMLIAGLILWRLH